MTWPILYLNVLLEGTFALSSIMLGSAITKGMQSRNLVPQTYNTSVNIGGNLTYQITDNSDQLLDEKIKIAMAVTLAVGIIQVSSRSKVLKWNTSQTKKSLPKYFEQLILKACYLVARQPSR